MSTNSPGETPLSSKAKKDRPDTKKDAYQQCNAFKKPVVVQQVKFEGKCDETKGRIFDCSDAIQSDNFTKSTKEMAEHVGRTYKYGNDTKLAIENLAIPTLEKPDDLPNSAGLTDKCIWEKEVEEYVKRKNALRENLKTVFSLTIGQCSKIRQQHLEARSNYTEMPRTTNSIALLKAIKNISSTSPSQSNDLFLHLSTRQTQQHANIPQSFSSSHQSH